VVGLSTTPASEKCLVFSQKKRFPKLKFHAKVAKNYAKNARSMVHLSKTLRSSRVLI